MPMSTYLRNAIGDHVFGATPLTAPAARYVSLHTASPGLTGANELAVANGYERRAGTFGAFASGASFNSAIVTYTNTGSAWSAATHFGVWDASTGGNFLGGDALSTARTVGAGNTATFAVAAAR
jgi:hypothetical protein